MAGWDSVRGGRRGHDAAPSHSLGISPPASSPRPPDSASPCATWPSHATTVSSSASEGTDSCSCGTWPPAGDSGGGGPGGSEGSGGTRSWVRGRFSCRDSTSRDPPLALSLSLPQGHPEAEGARGCRERGLLRRCAAAYPYPSSLSCPLFLAVCGESSLPTTCSSFPNSPGDGGPIAISGSYDRSVKVGDAPTRPPPSLLSLGRGRCPSMHAAPGA